MVVSVKGYTQLLAHVISYRCVNRSEVTELSYGLDMISFEQTCHLIRLRLPWYRLEVQVVYCYYLGVTEDSFNWCILRSWRCSTNVSSYLGDYSMHVSKRIRPLRTLPHERAQIKGNLR